MAWLDDSPVRKVGKFLEWKNAPVGRQFRENKENWRILHQFPLLNVLLKYLQSLFAHRKLNAIEQKIHSHRHDNMQAVLRLLKDLLQLKKQINQGTASKDHLQRIHDLKRILIRKSHGVLLSQEEDQHKAQQQQQSPVSSSHKTILGLIQTAADQEKTHLTQTLPAKVYWRYADTGIPAQHYGQPIMSTLVHSRVVRLHTSVDTLLSLLKNPPQHLSPISSDIQVSLHDDLAHANPALVCGVGLKFNTGPNKQQPGFWQSQPITSLLPAIKGDNVSEHINEIFFQTPEHFAQFKDLLHSHQEVRLLELISNLESREQIRIHQNAAVTVRPQ